jgi:hypothetical protein
MKIEIKIPESVVDTLKIKTLTDSEIVEVYQKYLSFMLQSDSWDAESCSKTY